MANVLALSGGMDSVYVFHQLLADKVEFKCIHVNHNMNVYDDMSQAFVENLCDIHKKELTVLKVYSTNETNAREMRYESISKHLNQNDVLYVGHHLEDSVETTLINIFNGTSLFGARGIDSNSSYKGINIFRPLIENKISKKDIRKYLVDNDIDWVEDNTNYDTSIKRNYIRHILLPQLKKAFNDPIEKISSFAEFCRIQSNLNSLLADYTDEYLKENGEYSIKNVKCLGDDELSNWFFCINRKNKLYLKKSHYAEFVKQLNGSGKLVELNDLHIFIDRANDIFKLEWL